MSRSSVENFSECFLRWLEPLTAQIQIIFFFKDFYFRSGIEPRLLDMLGKNCTAEL